MARGPTFRRRTAREQPGTVDAGIVVVAQRRPAVPHGVRAATTDPDQLRCWWSASARFGAAVRTGREFYPGRARHRRSDWRRDIGGPGDRARAPSEDRDRPERRRRPTPPVRSSRPSWHRSGQEYLHYEVQRASSSRRPWTWKLRGGDRTQQPAADGSRWPPREASSTWLDQRSAAIRPTPQRRRPTSHARGRRFETRRTHWSMSRRRAAAGPPPQRKRRGNCAMMPLESVSAMVRMWSSISSYMRTLAA